MPQHPETLPRAVQAQPGSPSSLRLESLLELRDEASYLGLVELEKLCCHEIHRCQRSPLSTSASGTLRGQGSVHSFHTLVERCQSRQEVRPSEPRVLKGNGGGRTAKYGARKSSSGSSFENKDVLVQERERQGKGVKYEVGSPPPGWI